MSRGMPLCWYCKRYHRTDVYTRPEVCDAFPGGIPREIVAEEFTHVKPYRSPDELLFDPVDEHAQEMVDSMIQAEVAWNRLSPEVRAAREADRKNVF